MRRFLFYLLIFTCSLLLSATQSDKVLICVSPNSYAYHSGYCQGLNRCTHEVISVTKEEAINRYGKAKACGYCY